MCCARLAEYTGCKKSPKVRHLSTIAQLCWVVSSQPRHVLTIGKKLVKPQYLLHMSSQYGKLQPTNGWDRFSCLEHPSKFQRLLHLAFVTAVTSLIRGQPNFARCLAGTLYVHFWGFLPLWWNFARCKFHFTCKSRVLLFWQRYCMALPQRSLAILCGMVQGMELWNFHRRRHLYLAGRPSRWHRPHASTTFFILVLQMLHLSHCFLLEYNQQIVLSVVQFAHKIEPLLPKFISKLLYLKLCLSSWLQHVYSTKLHTVCLLISLNDYISNDKS